MLDANDIRYILQLIEDKHGRGWVTGVSFGHRFPKDKTVGGLQAKLSIMLEVKTK